MSQGTAHTRTLQAAADTLGSASRLAAYLSVPLADLTRWISGEEHPPHDIFLRALDVVAGGPLLDPQERGQRNTAPTR